MNGSKQLLQAKASKGIPRGTAGGGEHPELDRLGWTCGVAPGLLDGAAESFLHH